MAVAELISAVSRLWKSSRRNGTTDSATDVGVNVTGSAGPLAAVVGSMVDKGPCIPSDVQ